MLQGKPELHCDDAASILKQIAQSPKRVESLTLFAPTV